MQAIIAARPDAVFNVTFGADLPRLVREGNLRGLFPRVPVVSLLSGEPEYLDVLKDETPKGWIVTGYPVESNFNAGAREVFQRVLQAIQRLSATRFGCRLCDIHRHLRSDPQSELGRYGKADRRTARLAMVDAVRPRSIPSRRSSVDNGSLCGQARCSRRQGRDGRLALRRWREVLAGAR